MDHIHRPSQAGSPSSSATLFAARNPCVYNKTTHHRKRSHAAVTQQHTMSAAAPAAAASQATEHAPVYTDLERGAARQQAQDLLSLYDFRIYGEGLTAGPFTSPAPTPDTTVVFAPAAATPPGPSTSPGAPAGSMGSTAAPAPPPAAPAAAQQQSTQAPLVKHDSSLWSDQRPGDPEWMQASPRAKPAPATAAGASLSTTSSVRGTIIAPAITTTTATTTSSSSSKSSAMPPTSGDTAALHLAPAGPLAALGTIQSPTTAAAQQKQQQQQQQYIYLQRGRAPLSVPSPAPTTAVAAALGASDAPYGFAVGDAIHTSSSRARTATHAPPWYHTPQVVLHQIVSAPGAALRWVWQLLVTLVTSLQRLLVTLVTTLRAGAWRLVRSVLELVGLSFLLLLGLVFGPWYQHNRASKAASAAGLARGLDRPFDAGAVSAALGALPSWLEGAGAGQLDRLTWLNNFIAEIWPVLDPYACGLIRSTVEPLLDQFKPPFIAKMGFQRLTLGDAPFQVEAVRLLGDDSGSARHTAGHSRRRATPSAGGAAGGPGELAPARPAGAGGEGRPAGAAAGEQQETNQGGGADLDNDQQLPSNARERVEFEVDFTWAGEPNIAFFVEMALLGPHSRLVPRVSNSTVKGTLRLSLTPLVPVVPGFGALLVSLTHTPQVRFTLDFGPALGGKFTAAPVATFLDPFIRDTLANLLVWPQRFVVPLLGEEVTGNLDQLQLRSRGVLQVEVLRAEGLVKKGVFHTLDPRVELWTQTGMKVTTGTKSRTRHPRWHKETFQLLVQEPGSQVLRAVVQDMEMFNLKELVQVNVLRGARNLLSNAVPIGRATLPLAQVCAKPEERQEVWLPLSGDEWEEDLGVSAKDRGRLLLGLTYTPFLEQAQDAAAPMACRGVLFVDVKRCRDLLSGDWQGHSSDPYVEVQVGNQTQRTAVVQQSLNPVYNTHHEFFNIQTHDVIRIRVRDHDFLKPDDFLGQVVVPVKDLVAWVGPGGRRGVQAGWWQLGSVERGAVELSLEYKAYSG